MDTAFTFLVHCSHVFSTLGPFSLAFSFLLSSLPSAAGLGLEHSRAHSVTDLQTPLGSVQRWDFCFLIRVFQIGTQSYIPSEHSFKKGVGEMLDLDLSRNIRLLQEENQAR